MTPALDTQLLIARLSERLPDQDLSVSGGPRSIAAIASIHPAIKDLVIVDDDTEFTVYVGDFTHRHFALPDVSGSADSEQDQTVNDVVDFIEGIVKDQIEFFGWGLGGGSRPRTGKPRNLISRIFLGWKTYVWSGPL